MEERKTRIVATLGPACAEPFIIREMVDAGLDVARLNFSHGTHEEHRTYAERVRRAAEEAGRPVALLQDVQGPKIRVGELQGGRAELTEGETVMLSPGAGPAPAGSLAVDYPHLLDDVEPGHQVLLADGLVRLEVLERRGDVLRARVETGGGVSDRQGAAFPDSDLSVPIVTDKDRRDLAFGGELEVDYVAASFVRTGADVARVGELAGVPVIAKIERAVAWENLGDILEVAAGAMVARGDLGVEIPLERVPLVQNEILARANHRGRITITATEMLESMTHSPRPTRAEVTDVVHSVLAGTDAVMLSGETATGRFPVRAVAAMDSICREAESNRRQANPPPVGFLTGQDPIPSATAKAAVEAAEALGLRTIVAFTNSGLTGVLLSKYRPRARILALTPHRETLQRMALLWGVRPRLLTGIRSTDELLRSGEALLREEGLCEEDETVVFVAGIPPDRGEPTNFIKLHRICFGEDG